MNAATRLIPASECEHIIALVDAKDHEPITQLTAKAMAEMLLGMYPARAVNNADVYVTAMTTLFAEYHIDFIQRVCHPIKGLPGRLKFLPTIAEVKEALDAQALARFRIRATAKWMLEERERRRLEAEEMAKYANIDVEARRKAVANLLKTKPLPGEPERGVEPLIADAAPGTGELPAGLAEPLL